MNYAKKGFVERVRMRGRCLIGELYAEREFYANTHNTNCVLSFNLFFLMTQSLSGG
jgi:hypothetical protein